MQEIFEKIRERLEERQENLDTDMWARQCDNWYGERQNGVSDGIDIAIEIVNQVAEEYSNSEIQNKPDDGWIPCSERLPESDISEEYYQAVILTLDTGRVAVGCYVNECNEWWADSESGKHYHEEVTEHVIAWQPLPAPYKPKGEK